MRIKSNKLIVYADGGRKYCFRYRRNEYYELSLAYLETWRRQHCHDTIDKIFESAFGFLKKNAIRPALFRMIDLTVIQLVLLLFFLATSITDMLRRGDEIVIFIRVFPTMVTLALSLLLWMRQVWAIWVSIVLSFVPLLLGLLLFIALPGARFDEGETEIEIAYLYMMMTLGILYAPVVIISCCLALERYYKLKFELKKDQIVSQGDAANA